jgi:hypothetical protein
MSNIILNATRALKVIPSDDCYVPTPFVLASGIVTGSSGGGTELADTSAIFFQNNSSGNREFKVNVGDVVYNITAQLAATITKVISNKIIQVNASIVTIGDEYIVYQSGQVTGLGNRGCLLYNGRQSAVGKDLEFETIGGDLVSLRDVSFGLIPIQALKVTTNTTLADLYALW